MLWGSEEPPCLRVGGIKGPVWVPPTAASAEPPQWKGRVVQACPAGHPAPGLLSQPPWLKLPWNHPCSSCQASARGQAPKTDRDRTSGDQERPHSEHTILFHQACGHQPDARAVASPAGGSLTCPPGPGTSYSPDTTSVHLMATQRGRGHRSVLGLPCRRPGLGDTHPKSRPRGRQRLKVQTEQGQLWGGQQGGPGTTGQGAKGGGAGSGGGALGPLACGTGSLALVLPPAALGSGRASEKQEPAWEGAGGQRERQVREAGM